MKPLVVVGDSLLDRDLDGRAERLCPDAPVPVVTDVVSSRRPGGAALAAVMAASDGRNVTLITALGDDDAGGDVADLVARAGIDLIDLGCEGATAEKVRVRAAHQPVVRLDHGGGHCGAIGPLSVAAGDALTGAAAVLVSDYGRGLSSHLEVRDELSRRIAGRQIVWDPHPRGAPPVRGIQVVTPNETEARSAAPEVTGAGLPSIVERARRLARRWHAGGVAVTLGSRGALLVQGDSPPLMVTAAAHSGDACGAGDRFASAVTAALADGAVPSEAVAEAVGVAARYVAAGGPEGLGSGGALPPTGGGVSVTTDALVGHVRSRGGVVVTTGGCFDLLHSGHVRVLDQARQLGDCLVVLLNSDDSVRRLKGPGRPMVPAADRAAVLMALSSVDAVFVFDEDTPCVALERLRPELFVKGGDYAADEIPEQAVMAGWGGQCVVLPYLAGYSTTAMMKEAQRHGVA